MVKTLLQRTGLWRAWESVATRVLDVFFITEPAEDFGGFVSASMTAGGSGAAALPPSLAPFKPRPPVSIAPASVETRFMRLHAEGRFDEMWDMVAEDAQRAWGSRENFVREMPRLDSWMEILGLEAIDVTILDSWTDHVHRQTYDNVARLVMRYHVRQQWKEWSFDRHVHLVPGPGGWRTLCYPMRVRAAASR